MWNVGITTWDTDAGVNLYGNAILASNAMITQNPAAVSAFLRATNRAIQESFADPVAAIAATKAREPILNEAVELELWRITREYVAAADTRGHGLGDRARIQRSDAERQEAALRLVQMQDRVAAEVVQADKARLAALRQMDRAARQVPEALRSLALNEANIRREHLRATEAPNLARLDSAQEFRLNVER